MSVIRPQRDSLDHQVNCRKMLVITVAVDGFEAQHPDLSALDEPFAAINLVVK